MKNSVLKLILGIFIVFSLSFGITYGYTISQIDKIYSKVILKLEKKYDIKKELLILEKLDKKIDYILEKKKLSEEKRKIIERLSYLNKKQISKLKSIIYGESKYKQFKDIGKIDLSSQEKKEQIIYNSFLKAKNNFQEASYIKSLESYGKKFYYTNSKFEFPDNNEIKKVIFSKYYPIDSSNYTYFKDKNGIIIYSPDLGYVFVEKYSFERKIPYSKAGNIVLGYLSDNKKYLLDKDGYYYLYRFDKYSHISDVYGFYLSDLKRIGFIPNKLLLYIDSKNKFNFVSDYEKVKLVSKGFLSNIENKSLFLKILSDDYKYLNKDYRKELVEIKKLSEKLTKGLSYEEKIEKIYDWILKDISYTENIDLSDYKIFSGLETFKNKSGVCEGYVKLMVYMLLYSGINNVEDIRGYVIDAPDFPKIGHAWLKIADKYYDPTFDDPVGSEKTKTKNEYKYYALPKDLFYTNRFDYGELPEYIKKLSLDERKKIILDNLFKVVRKYLNKDYLLLRPIKFRIKYGFGKKLKLTIDDFKKVLKTYEVKNYVFYDENGEKRHIEKISYYVVNDDNIEDLIENNFAYNIDGVILLKWDLGNGKYEYRIPKSIIIK